MFKKKEKPVKEKKVRTVKVGTHKKSVIALWVVLIASVSFGVYKNFTFFFLFKHGFQSFLLFYSSSTNQVLLPIRIIKVGISDRVA